MACSVGKTMIETELEAKVKNMILGAGEVAIIPSMVSDVDAFSAAAGIYRMLEAKGARPTILFPGELAEEVKSIAEGLNINQNVASRSLTVSIDYSNTPASQVHYNTENDVLYITLSPVDHDFDLTKVKSEIVGPNYDLFITIGIPTLEDLGPLKKDLEFEFARVPVLNLDNTSVNTRYGNVYVVDTAMDRLSLLVMNKAPKWGLVLDSKAAKALIVGVNHKSMN